jgi:AcrR family transcriptional regulator
LPAQEPRVLRKRNRQSTIRALKDAAVAVFAAQGYDAATTRAVAQAAGVSEQLIQRYFAGKAGLLRAIMENYAESDRNGLFGIPPSADSVEAEIESFLCFSLEREKKFGDFARVAIYRSVVDPEIASQIARMFTQSREPLALERLKALRTKGLIDRRADLPAMAHILSTLSFALAFNDQLLFDRSPTTLRRSIRAFARTMASGLASGGGKPVGEPRA